MTSDQEIKEIMRAALDDIKDRTLAELSSRDNRVVSIASSLSDSRVLMRIADERIGMLKWSLIQALIGCLLFGAICVFGAYTSANGGRLELGAIMIGATGLALIPTPVVQLLASFKPSRLR